jgi:hypothetical protein
MGEIEASKIAYANENENGDGNDREGWKVMGFGLAWFWLLLLVHRYHSPQVMRYFEHTPPG